MWTVILTVFCLVAGESAFFTFGFGVEPIAVGIKLGFGEVLVVGNFVFCAKFFGLPPGFTFDLEPFNIGTKIVVLSKKMSELVQKK